MEMEAPQSLNSNPIHNIKRQKRFMRSHGGGIGFHDNGRASYLIVKIPNSKVMTFLARSILLACIIVSIPWFRSALERSMNNSDIDRARSEKLSTAYRDLNKEDKALFLCKRYDDVLNSIKGDTFKMFEIPTNYKTIYFWKLDSSILAMRKSNALNGGALGGRRRLLGLKSKEEKKAALRKLEDVLLEPPRSASGRSKSYLKKTRYLPDLMGDSLEGYPRRVFIDVGSSPTNVEGDRSTEWFARNYPTRNLEFELYRIETVSEDEGTVSQTGMSDWLRKNVNDEEYVVMRAEAEVVEEIVKSKAIEMVDELFLDCKPRRCRRAYWECLALYGRLRDEGVAVHQWWG